MTRARSRRLSRPGFTLIELLVVIGIIAILVSLTAAGVLKTLAMVPQVQTRTEIGQLETAVQTVIQTYRLKFLPSQIKLSETCNYPQQTNPLSLDYSSVQFLKRMFPRINLTSPTGGYIDWNRNGKPDGDVTLQGPECLVFFLGGPGGQGFSADPANPANTVSIQASAFNFNTSRLIPSPYVASQGSVTGYSVYLDNYGKGARPYLYFSSYYQGNDYLPDCSFSAYNVSPYQNPSTLQYINPQSFQIISAGKDNNYGAGGMVWNPSSGTSDPPTLDNQANFASGLLAVGQ
jgi:prepilin-type N-terminal cleavage/methylation domain-containing protein